MRLLNRILGDGLDIAKQIAFSHSLFNVLLVCLFLPSMGLLTLLLCWLVPSKPHKEAPHLTFLDVRMLDTPAFGIQQSFDEIRRMGDGVHKMLGWLRACLLDEHRDEEREQKVFHREEVLDIMQKEVVEFLGSLVSGTVPHDLMVESRKQLRIADEYESISDYAVSLLKLDLKRRGLDLAISTEDRAALLHLHDIVAAYVDMITTAVQAGDRDVLSKARTQGDTITHLMKESRTAHLRRMESQHVSPLNCLVFVDML